MVYIQNTIKNDVQRTQKRDIYEYQNGRLEEDRVVNSRKSFFRRISRCSSSIRIFGWWILRTSITFLTSSFLFSGRSRWSSMSSILCIREEEEKKEKWNYIGADFRKSSGDNFSNIGLRKWCDLCDFFIRQIVPDTHSDNRSFVFRKCI